MKSQWMLYGANGYSVQLAIEKAIEQGKTPIFTGRNQAAIEALGKSLTCQFASLI